MRDGVLKEELHIENAHDYVFGMAVGEINIGFSGYYNTVHRGEQPDDATRKEIAQIIIRRLPEIRQAVYFEE